MAAAQWGGRSREQVFPGEVSANMQSESRREFLGKTVLAAPAVAVLGGEAIAAPTQVSGSGRRVVPVGPGASFSRAVILGNLVYVAGVVGRKPGSSELASPTLASQCKQALENLTASVEAAGSTMQNVLKCTCYLTDVKGFPAMNKLFRRYFPTDPPARMVP